MTPRKFFRVPTLLVFVLLALVAGCDSLTTSTTKTVKKRTGADFAAYAYQHGIAGVEFGQLGMRQSSNPAVRSFAQKLVQDNTEANKQMKFTAEDLRLTLPAGMSAEQIATRNELAVLTGTEFDKQYMSAMVKDLDDTKAEFEAHSANGDVDTIKRFAARFLGTLTNDRNLAHQTAEKVGAK